MTIQKNKNIVLRKIGDSFFLIDITENYLDDKCRLYEINQIGCFIWEHIIEKTKSTDITKELIRAITDEIDESIVSHDVDEFIGSLLSIGFVQEC